MGQIKFDINLIFIVVVEEWDLKKMWCRELDTHVEHFSKTEEVMEDSGSGI